MLLRDCRTAIILTNLKKIKKIKKFKKYYAGKSTPATVVEPTLVVSIVNSVP